MESVQRKTHHSAHWLIRPNGSNMIENFSGEGVHNEASSVKVSDWKLPFNKTKIPLSKKYKRVQILRRIYLNSIHGNKCGLV